MEDLILKIINHGKEKREILNNIIKEAK